jgi:hypothetical protein
MVYHYKYYVFGHYPSSCPFFKKHNVSETGFCLHPQVKPTQLDPIDRASPYLQTPMSVTQGVHKISTPQISLFHSKSKHSSQYTNLEQLYEEHLKIRNSQYLTYDSMDFGQISIWQ